MVQELTKNCFSKKQYEGKDDNVKIVKLSSLEYKGFKLDYSYRTKAFYEVKIKRKTGIEISVKRRKTFQKIEKVFSSTLFDHYVMNSDVFAIFSKKEIIAVIEGSLVSHTNRYRIWNLLVSKKFRGEGYGYQLFKHIETVAKKSGARALVLEVQSCNDQAIKFYLKQGLHFVGLDTMFYTNEDIERKEVRLEMGRRLTV